MDFNIKQYRLIPIFRDTQYSRSIGANRSSENPRRKLFARIVRCRYRCRNAARKNNPARGKSTVCTERDVSLSSSDRNMVDPPAIFSAVRLKRPAAAASLDFLPFLRAQRPAARRFRARARAINYGASNYSSLRGRWRIGCNSRFIVRRGGHCTRLPREDDPTRRATIMQRYNAVTTRGYLTRGSFTLARSSTREDGNGGASLHPAVSACFFSGCPLAASPYPHLRASPNRQALHPYLRYYLAPLYAWLKPSPQTR